MMLKALASNYELVVAILLFVIGFCMLLFDRNLLKKVIGLDIMAVSYTHLTLPTN